MVKSKSVWESVKKIWEFLNRADTIPWIVMLVTIIAAFVGGYVSYMLVEGESYSNLQLSNVKFERGYIYQNNNTTEFIEIKRIITLFNTKRADYPARISAVRSEIIDDDNLTSVTNTSSGFESTIVLPGDSIDINSQFIMKLNKPGNYTIQTTVKYLDVKSGKLENLYFFSQIIVSSSNSYSEQPYIARFKNIGIFNEFWTIGIGEHYDAYLNKAKYIPNICLLYTSDAADEEDS